MIDVESTSVERPRAAIRTPQDPTGSLPEWSLTVGDRSDPSTWHEGRWPGDWNSDNGRVEVEGALLGPGQAMEIAAGEVANMWLRFTNGDETPVLLVGSIRGL